MNKFVTRILPATGMLAISALATRLSEGADPAKLENSNKAALAAIMEHSGYLSVFDEVELIQELQAKLPADKESFAFETTQERIAHLICNINEQLGIVAVRNR